MRKSATIAAALLAVSAGASAFDPVKQGNLTLEPSVNLRLGLQYAGGINYGYGPYDTPGERERSSMSGSIEPGLKLGWKLDGSELYGGVSIVAATTQLDGELSGQFGREGDTDFGLDTAYVGWKNEWLDLSYGAQPFVVGDGLLLGDGNFDVGKTDGQFWTAPYDAWRNSAIARINGGPLRADLFWLRSDVDFGDSRLLGVNVETNTQLERGKLGFMYLEVTEADGRGFGLGNDGLEVWDFRAANVKVPAVPNLEFFAEFVRQGGRDQDRRQRNDAYGGHIEAQYHFKTWLTPTLAYRYARFSGDELDTPTVNEGYRSLFYGFYTREWDTWYQGEVAGEYHLFNSNQISHMVKLKAMAREDVAVTLYWYRHDLEEANYFGVPLKSTRWGDELNLGAEYFIGHKFYGYVGALWGLPSEAATEFFGSDDDFVVLQTWLSYTF